MRRSSLAINILTRCHGWFIFLLVTLVLQSYWQTCNKLQSQGLDPNLWHDKVRYFRRRIGYHSTECCRRRRTQSSFIPVQHNLTLSEMLMVQQRNRVLFVAHIPLSRFFIQCTVCWWQTYRQIAGFVYVITNAAGLDGFDEKFVLQGADWRLGLSTSQTSSDPLIFCLELILDPCRSRRSGNSVLMYWPSIISFMTFLPWFGALLKFVHRHFGQRAELVALLYTLYVSQLCNISLRSEQLKGI